MSNLILYTSEDGTTRMNLRLDHNLGAQTACGLGCFGGRIGDLAARRRNTEFLKQFFGLVFVDIHREKKCAGGEARQLTGGT